MFGINVAESELRNPGKISQTRSVRMHALKLLNEDHSIVRILFERLEGTEKAAHEKKNDLFAEIRRELQIHLKGEEEIFYPALKALNGGGWNLVSEALKQHKDIEQLLTQISRLKPSDRNYDEKIEMLIESVDRHFEGEEGEIFRFAEENCSLEQLEDLGRQIEERKKILDEQMAA
jgi:hemerythrin superfamily protein